MNASELFKAGQLQPAIDAQVQKVKSNPADQEARLFLFELLYFAGDLDRAQRHLEMLRYDDPQLTVAAQTYLRALDAERSRRRVLAGQDRPRVLYEPPEHVELRLEALAHLARGEKAEAASKLDRANGQIPLIKGHLNGKPFEGLRDGDDLFGSVVEVFGQGGMYSWVPLEQVESLTMNAPSTPRDLILIPAQLVTRGGIAGDVLLPAIYPGSHEAADDQLKLGHQTEWADVEGEPVRGLGGKMWLLGDGSHGVSLLEVRQLVCDTGAPEQPAS
ncbi:MAG TPA: type VI secretion system accessory protein TagJ [Gemmataceae bacterium]